MNAKALIGKVAIRTKPVDGDRSYCSGTGTMILNATDTHVYITSLYGKAPYALDARWLEDWDEFQPEPPSNG